MNKSPYIILISTILFILTACSIDPQPEAEDLLVEAESLAESDPDSAFQLIDSIMYPQQSLSRGQYMRYLVTNVQVKYKTYRPVDEDTLIFNARNYFSEKGKDNRMTTLAWFYSGCVFREQKDLAKAMEHYKEAASYAKLAGDEALEGLVVHNMGDLMAEQGVYDVALEHYRQSVKLHNTIPCRIPDSYSAMGRMYLLMQQPDSAFYFFHKGLELAEELDNYESIILISQNLNVAYTRDKEYDKAEFYLRQSFNLNRDSTNLPRYYLNFANLYRGVNNPDSVLWYIDQLKLVVDSAEDDYYKFSVYKYLSEWEKENSNFDAAFSYQTQQMNTLIRIMNERGKESVYAANKKYDYEKVQKQYYMDLTVRQKWIIMLITALFCGGSLFTYYWVRQRNRRAEALSTIETLQSMNHELESSLHEKQQELRKNILWRFSVSREMLELNKQLNKPDTIKLNDSQWVGRFNKIVYGKRDIKGLWDAILETYEEALPGLSEKVKNKYPDLSESELKICLLVYAGFTVKESAIILDLSPNTIQTRRTGVRNKMGLSLRGDIAAEIDKLV